VTITEWGPIADRINRLWQPPMGADIAEEYYAVLEEFPAVHVAKAVSLAAKMPRPFRPDVGTLYQAAESLEKAKRAADPVPVEDPLTAEESRRGLAELRVKQSAEHRRRHEAVVDLLRSTGYRVPLAVLPDLMAAKMSSAEQFDRRMAEHRERAPRRLLVARDDG
jgi:hypothetical protein